MLYVRCIFFLEILKYEKVYVRIKEIWYLNKEE